MVFGLVYLSVNLACLWLLVRWKYYRTFPMFLTAQALTCWVAFTTLFVFGKSREVWMQRWQPGETFLLLAAAVAIGEAIWKSVRQSNTLKRALIIAGYVVLGAIAIVATFRPLAGDWYEQFQQVRTYVLLAFAVITAAAWLAGIRWRRTAYRGARLHLGILAGLFVGRVLIVDVLQWSNSNLKYRILEMACCAGWTANARFLCGEFDSIAQRVLASVQTVADGVPSFRGGLPVSRPQARRSSFRHAPQGD